MKDPRYVLVTKRKGARGTNPTLQNYVEMQIKIGRRRARSQAAACEQAGAEQYRRLLNS
jgi:hypothetical protein